MRRERSLYFYMILLIIFSVTFLIVGALYFVIRPYKHATWLFHGDWMTVDDAVIGYAAAKQASSVRERTDGTVRFQVFTDERGARITEKGQETPEKVTILTVGGSFVWGQGVENQETFTALLGQRFGVPVANFAYAGYGTLHALQMMERHIDL